MNDTAAQENRQQMTAVELGAIIAQSHFTGQGYMDRIDDLLDQESRVVVQTDEDYDRACDLLKFMKDVKKDADGQRKKDKQPILEAGRLLDAWYKPATDSLSAAIDRVNGTVVQYMNEKRRKEQEAREEAALAAAEKDPERADDYIDNAVKDAPAKAHTSTHGAQTHIQKRLSSVAVADWSKVPDEYKMLDSEKVKKAIRAGVEVPGVEPHYTETAVSR